ncbi:nucleoside deaminase [Salinibacterium soli]|uniref:Nucleoside deaminase n=1 Tax=Antiquaquibacter soli TaxID=3064523 RepID=A0ABT9BNM2_9MICO|nr:nucleoside deaminase [Protaetiibacter sp. WY-16]MDO7882615.1 nucleoside deaminase [Protaetiibacter sp. WY-16]
MSEVTAQDERYLRESIDAALEARGRGDHPFGAVLVTAGGRVIRGFNSVVTDGDPTGHAESNLVRIAARELTADELRKSTLYSSTEPCAMCAGAIYWARIPRVVFALSEQGLIAIVSPVSDEPVLDLPSREVFARGGDVVDVAGPALEVEAAAVHDGFWG